MFRYCLLFIVAIIQLQAVGFAAEPKQPIFGARSPADGSIQLNPAWTEPVVSLLLHSTAIVVVDTESKGRHFIEIPEELQGENSMPLLGPIIASVGSGEVVTVNDGEPHLWIMTDKEGFAIAKLIIPMAFDSLLSDDAAEERRAGMSIEGRWVASRHEVTPETPKHLATLAAWQVNTVEHGQITFAESFEPGAKSKSYHYRIELGQAQPTITLNNVETQEILSGAFWADTGKKHANAFGFVLLNDDSSRAPGSVEQSQWVTRLAFERDEDDPKWIMNQVNDLRMIAIRNLLSDRVNDYRSARDFLRYSIAMEEEAKMREKAEDAVAQHATLEEEERYAEARQMKSKAENYALEAEELKAVRIAQQRLDQEMMRQRAEADQLVQRIESLRSEGEIQRALESEQVLNDLLRGADDDNFRIVDLERRAVNARLDNNHAFADQLKQEAAELRKALDSRYQLSHPAGDDYASPRQSRVIVLKHSKVDDSINVLKALEMLANDFSVVSPGENVILLSGSPAKINDAQKIIETIENAAAGQRPIGGHVASSDQPEFGFLMQTLKGLPGVDDQQVEDWTAEEGVIRGLVDQKGVDDPDVQDRLAMLGARYRLYSGENHAFEVTDWDAVIARQKRRYEESERMAAKTANEFRSVTGSTPADESRRLQLETELKSQVSGAFGTRLVLQLMQLEKASRDLQASQQRLSRRYALIDPIVQRRVDDLLADGELSWLQGDETEQPEFRSAGTAYDVSDLVMPKSATDPSGRRPAIDDPFAVDPKVDPGATDPHDNQLANVEESQAGEVLELMMKAQQTLEKEIQQLELEYQALAAKAKWKGDKLMTFNLHAKRIEELNMSHLQLELEQADAKVKRAELEKLRERAEKTPAHREVQNAVKRIMGDDASNEDGSFEKAIQSLDSDVQLLAARLEQITVMVKKEMAIANEVFETERKHEEFRNQLERKRALLKQLVQRIEEVKSKPAQTPDVRHPSPL